MLADRRRRAAHHRARSCRLPEHTHHERASGTGFEVQYLLDTAPGSPRRSRRPARLAGPAGRLGGRGRHRRRHLERARAHRRRRRGGRGRHRGRAPVPDHGLPFDGPAAAEGRRGHRDRPRRRRSAGCSRARGCASSPTTSRASATSSRPCWPPTPARSCCCPTTPRSPAIADAAAAEVRERGVRVAVVPTRSPVQGLAAVAVHDASRRFDDDVVAMAEAAAATRFAEVIVAEREALTSAGHLPGRRRPRADRRRGRRDRARHPRGRARGQRPAAGHRRRADDRAASAPPRSPASATVLRRHVRDRSPLTEVTVYDGRPTGTCR